ncbi:mucosal addressin cell adhesion molecule 1 [Ambystoma mexicanum]|uniref:mucosal addressin cell adhesion molecule 1 n=1 Tax=Ambystoma mexicanum TaxID=8296 RepID=UPI0037E923CC
MSSPEQIQEMCNAIQSLRADMQSLHAENLLLRQQATTREAGRDDLPPMPFTFGKYDGNPRFIKEFLDACAVYFSFRPRAFESGRARVGFLIANLTGSALAWATPLVTNQDPPVNDYALFVQDFKNRFERSEVQYDAFLDVRQGNQDLQGYIAQFQALAVSAGWPDMVQQTIFRRGLNEELKDELGRVVRPNTFQELVTIVLQIDYRLQERRAERRRGRGSAPRYSPPQGRRERPTPEEPMQIGSTRGPLTKTERRRRLKQNLSVRAMLDCGAARNFIDVTWAQENQIPLREKDRPIPVEGVDGRPLSSGLITMETEPVTRIKGQLRQRLDPPSSGAEEAESRLLAEQNSSSSSSRRAAYPGPDLPAAGMEKQRPILLLMQLSLLLRSDGQPIRKGSPLSLVPRNPLVHLGDPVQFNCSRDCPSVIFNWKGLDTKPGSVSSTPRYSVLFIASAAVHNEGSIICEATCQGHRSQGSSQLRIYSLPDTMQLDQHPEDSGSGQPAHLTCTIRRVYPLDALTLSWYQGERKLDSPEQQDISSEDDDRDEVQSYQLRLDLPRGTAIDGAAYHCEAELRLEDSTVRRNKTLIYNEPAGHTSAATSAPSMAHPITAVTIKPNSTTETATARHIKTETATTHVGTSKTAATGAVPSTDAVTTRVNPTSETATEMSSRTESSKVNSRNETSITRLSTRAEAATTRANPKHETTTEMSSTTDSEAATTLNPAEKTVICKGSPKNETATSRGHVTNENATNIVIPTTETVLAKGHPETERYSIKGYSPTEIPTTRRRSSAELLSSRLRDSAARKRSSSTKHAVITRPTTTLPTSFKSKQPTRRAPPEVGVDMDSVAVWTVFSVLGLLTSSVGIRHLWKRLRFWGAKKGSFELDRL